jgi:hypothetical protein
MSLASTASPWINDDGPKKRTPVMNRKTIKTRPANYFTDNNDKQDYMIFDTTEIQQTADERTNKVTEIINQMSAVTIENDGSKLADFAPPPNPAVQQRKPAESNLGIPLQIPTSQDSAKIQRTQEPVNNKIPVQRQVDAFTNSTPAGNYQQVYSGTNTSNGTFMTTPPNFGNKPYYSSLGLGSGDGKLLEKINYMIHMLENMEMEKTANITEEFVLYSFTGIFIIFVLDSFLKTGKYVR